MTSEGQTKSLSKAPSVPVNETNFSQKVIDQNVINENPIKQKVNNENTIKDSMEIDQKTKNETKSEHRQNIIIVRKVTFIFFVMFLKSLIFVFCFFVNRD